MLRFLAHGHRTVYRDLAQQQEGDGRAVLYNASGQNLAFMKISEIVHGNDSCEMCA